MIEMDFPGTLLISGAGDRINSLLCVHIHVVESASNLERSQHSSCYEKIL